MLRLLAVVMIVMSWSAPVLGGSDELRPDAFNPSARCGQCHEEIYSMWRRSMHSLAFEDPIFKVSYMQAYLETAGEARRVCLRCHAPTAVITGDLEVREPVSREGVTCDFCHSVASVDLENRDQPFRISLDGIKRGPLGDAESPAHGVAKSELHESAEFCAGCHEYFNEAGVPILSTYSEWKRSPQAAEGKTCQNCHMPLTAGNTVRPDLRAGRKGINLHNISGAHSSEQVRRSATAKILSLQREQPTLAALEVEVANVGSGHYIPTGLPTRKLILEVTLFSDGREIRRFERQYQKTLADAEGRIITTDHRAMLAARKILQDSRLRPAERRLERFVTEVPPRGALRAEVELRYSYEPQLLSRTEMSIEIASDHTP